VRRVDWPLVWSLLLVIVCLAVTAWVLMLGARALT
jgi:hypothetical protein